MEIHHKMSPEDDEEEKPKSKSGSIVMMMVLQVVVIDLVFSTDSIHTAIGLTREIGIMVIAVVLSMAFMLLFAKVVSDFINKNPTIVMLALAFLVSIALLLILEGFHQGEKIEPGYVYFEIAFAFTVKLLNLSVLRKKRAVKEARKPATNKGNRATETAEETVTETEAEAQKRTKLSLRKRRKNLIKTRSQMLNPTTCDDSSLGPNGNSSDQ
jgi:hypothetical protein